MLLQWSREFCFPCFSFSPFFLPPAGSSALQFRPPTTSPPPPLVISLFSFSLSRAQPRFPMPKICAPRAEEEEEEPAPRISSLANMSGVGGGGRGNTHVNPRTVKFLVLDGGSRANWHYNIFPPKKGRKTLLVVLLQCVGRCCVTFCRLPPCSLP